MAAALMTAVLNSQRLQPLRDRREPARTGTFTLPPCCVSMKQHVARSRVRPDRSKIDLSSPDQVKWWTRHLKVSQEMLVTTVGKVGNAAAAVRKELVLRQPQRKDASEPPGVLLNPADTPSIAPTELVP